MCYSDVLYLYMKIYLIRHCLEPFEFLKHGFLHAFSWSNISYDLKVERKTRRVQFHMYLNNKWWFKLSDCLWTLRFFMWFFYLQALIKSFLPNLRSTSAVTRRTAASCLVLICEHSRSSASFYNYLLGSLLGEPFYWGILRIFFFNQWRQS